MTEFVDQLNRNVSLASLPVRILSLVPSQTELLYDLGLRDEVIGITKFCIHPDVWFRSKPRLGGTKKVDFEKIHSLKPDLIIGNKEENDQSQIEALMKHYPVWMSEINNLDDALEMIGHVGQLTGKSANASQLKNKIEDQFLRFNPKSKIRNPHLRIAYLIWQNPYMTIGNNTFIHDMLTRCGFKNVFADKSRYPEIKMEELIAAHPDLILLSSEPYPFKEKHCIELQTRCPESKVMLADGELFSWYGSRLLKSTDYFLRLIEQIHTGD